MHINNYLVSILIPCYNGEKFIDHCINSVVNQTYKNIEIIIIDDGSVDNSWKKLSDWSKRDNRIKIFKQENHGLSFNRNKLISLSNGYYFFFLDIDDTIPLNTIELLVNNSDNFKNEIVVGRTILKIGNKMKFPFVPTWRFTNMMTNSHYVKSNICPPWACIIKKSFFDNLNVKFINNRIFEDIGIMTYVFLKAKNFKSIKNITYYYCIHSNKDEHNNQLSNFGVKCYKKINDLYHQTDQILSLLTHEKQFLTKEYKRYINGLFFQVIPSNIFLLNNLTNDSDIKYLLKYNLLSLINNSGYKFRFSKTFWKSVTYFYIMINNKKILKDVEHNRYNLKFISGKYLDKYKSNNCFNIIKNSNIKDIFSSKKYIFELDTNQLSSLKLVKENAYICLDYNDQIYKSDFIKEIYLKNIVLFTKIDENIKLDDLKIAYEIAVGFIFKINEQTNFKKLKQLILSINGNYNKRLVFLIVENRELIENNKEILDCVNRVYYSE